MGVHGFDTFLDTQEDTLALDIGKYKKTKHHGLKIHENGIAFLFDIRVEGKRYRKVWKSNPNHTKADRLKSAYRQLEEYRDAVKRRDNFAELDFNATINDG